MVWLDIEPRFAFFPPLSLQSRQGHDHDQALATTVMSGYGNLLWHDSATAAAHPNRLESIRDRERSAPNRCPERRRRAIRSYQETRTHRVPAAGRTLILDTRSGRCAYHTSNIPSAGTSVSYADLSPRDLQKRALGTPGALQTRRVGGREEGKGGWEPAWEGNPASRAGWRRLRGDPGNHIISECSGLAPTTLHRPGGTCAVHNVRTWKDGLCDRTSISSSPMASFLGTFNSRKKSENIMRLR